VRNGEGAGDILGLRLGTDTAPVPLVATQFSESQPMVSPNGRWLAYVSDESGTPEVYVVPFPNTGDGRWLVSSDGGQEPVWGPDGSELFYKSPSQLIVAAVTTDPTFDVFGERALFVITGHQNDLTHRRYDVTPDSKRFVMIRNIPFQGQGEDPVLVLNFLEELKSKAGNE
jgi:Tol biopolymer transport system component